MIITKLLNNLKCLTGLYYSLLTLVDNIEPTLDNYFITESILIESSGDDGFATHVFELPLGIQLISIFLVRVGEAGFDDVETINVDEYTQVVNIDKTIVTVTTNGTHSLNDYELQVIYRML